MNKKFSTLMAGLLLAGGFVSNVSAEQFDATKDYGDQYYRVLVDGSGSISPSSQWLDVDGTVADASVRYSLEENKSTMWTIKKVTSTVNGITTVIGYQLINALTNEPLSVTVKEDGKDVVYNVFGGKYASLFFVNPDGTPAGKYYIGKDNELSTSAEKGHYWAYDLVAVAPSALTKTELEAQNGDSFSIQIGYQETKDGKQVWNEYTTFEGGNVFAGKLYVGEKTTDGSAAQYALYTDAARTKRIVLTTDKWEVTSSQLGSGYKFDILTNSEYAAEVAKGDDSKILADQFIISAPATVQGDPIEVVATNGTDKYELVVSVVKNAAGQNVNRLTVADAITDNTADYNNQHGGNTYVKFGQSNVADMSQFANKLWNIYKNGKVLSPADGKSFINASEVYAKGTEGLWLWNGTQFVNRESDAEWTPVTLRNTDTQYEFTNGEDVYTFVAQGTPAPNGTTDGYLASLSDDQLKQNAFWIASPLSVGDTLYIAKGQNGVLEMTKDKAEAVEFRLARVAFGDEENNMQAQLRNGYLEDASEDKSNTDRVNLYQYSLVEAVSGDVLNYDNNQYVLEDISGKTEKEIQNLMKSNKYVFKVKGDNLYNILTGVAAEYSATANDKNYIVTDKYFSNGKVKKLYGAFNTGRLVASENAYESVQNDLFVVVNADAQQYRGDFSNAGALDTVKIFRNDDPSYVLYEKGTLLADAKGEAIEGFLGMENVLDPQYATKQPAMLADTAKHANTYRPQYMFAVDAEYVADGWTCPLNPEHNTAAWREENGGHCADAIQDRPYMLGRYLVTLADSAQAAEKAGVKEAVNKFKHEGFYRLGFVQAKHMGDSLIIASGTAAQDTIDLSKGYDLPCTFALKYVDENREAFTIETMYEKEYNTYGEYTPAANTKGYIKYQNGVPVVTDKKNEAWVFDLETLTGEENAPTANETIAAGNVVVAGTNGAVVVKGAEGKSVIVSTILGKVVANEVLTSDNAQITAPAGVVVVSVDGESFKVVVK